jgi:hypothetical protein
MAVGLDGPEGPVIGWVDGMGVEALLELGRRDVAEFSVKALAVVEPHPGNGRVLGRLEAREGAPAHELGLEGGHEGFGHRVVVGIATGSHRRIDAQLVEAIGVAQARKLRSAVRVGDERSVQIAQRHGHLEGVDHQLGAHVGGDLPADDPAREDVENEGQVAEARVGADVGDVGDPQAIGAGGDELAIDKIAGPIDRVLVGRCGAHATAAADALKALGAHQPADPVAADLDAATAQLAPGLADAVDPPVAGPGGVDLLHQLDVGDGPRRRGPPAVGVVAGGGDAESAADRLDPQALLVGLDVGAHRLGRGRAPPRRKSRPTSGSR